jgi:hypothetical protein
MKTRFLPSFKGTCILVGTLYILLSISLFLRGLLINSEENQIAPNLLELINNSLFWINLHLFVIGLFILIFGFTIIKINQQKGICSLLFFINILYAFLDFRSADSFFGSSLFQDSTSVIPAFFSLLIALLFLMQNIRLMKQKEEN